MKRVAEVACVVQRAGASLIRYHAAFEVSFDCLLCTKLHRTIRFDGIGQLGVCQSSGGNHSFAGILHSMFPFESDSESFVSYKIHYEFTPFIDSQSGKESDPTPTWCRVALDATCSVCGVQSTGLIESDLVAPSKICCPCGTHLYDYLREMPLLRDWMGDP